MILIICEFCYEILYESSIHLFFKSKIKTKKTKKNTGELRERPPLPVAGEVLPWKLSRFGPECAHVPLFTVLIVLFLSLVEGREYLFFFFSNSLNFFVSFQCLFFNYFFNFQYSHVSLAVLLLEMFFGRIILSFLWNCWYNDGDG